MWIHARFLDSNGQGPRRARAYGRSTATLDAASTTVYEARHGVDDAVSASTGIPVGHSFHMAVNNEVLFDDRIPPRGFSNAEFEAIHSEPLGHSYPEQHYWDDTSFAIPHGTTQVEVELYYQTTAREFIEFVRDANVTNSAGQTAYDQWVAQGMSAPVLMATRTLDLAAGAIPDPIRTDEGRRPRSAPSADDPELGNELLGEQLPLRIQNGKPNQFGVMFWAMRPPRRRSSAARATSGTR
jgi:hypothetical protein